MDDLANKSLQIALDAVKREGRAELQREVYMWLGYYRDRMPEDLVTTLQRVLGPLDQ